MGLFSFLLCTSMFYFSAECIGTVKGHVALKGTCSADIFCVTGSDMRSLA